MDRPTRSGSSSGRCCLSPCRGKQKRLGARTALDGCPAPARDGRRVRPAHVVGDQEPQLPGLTRPATDFGAPATTGDCGLQPEASFP